MVKLVNTTDLKSVALRLVGSSPTTRTNNRRDMTRINVVPVEELCDQHLLAEARELPRIPNHVANRQGDVNTTLGDYRLGEGHVRFFYDKLNWLERRYNDLLEECKIRGFQVQDRWPKHYVFPNRLRGDYVVTREARAINRQRIDERKLNFVPRYTVVTD